MQRTPKSRVSKSDRTWQAGSSFSPSGQELSASNPICWSKCRRGRPARAKLVFQLSKSSCDPKITIIPSQLAASQSEAATHSKDPYLSQELIFPAARHDQNVL